jgi:hypothetical protein
MSYEKRIPNWKEKVIEASNSHQSAAKAAASLGIKYDTFKKYAELYGCFIPNQAGKGTKKDASGITFPLEDILGGAHPHYKTAKLKKRLYEAGLKEEKCEECNLESTWNGKPITLHLDHINGISTDHRLENLRILCPNCHSQTDTYSGKNRVSSENRALISQPVEENGLEPFQSQFESE